MGALQNTVFIILFIGPLITVHELGHFIVAKWAGVKVLKFSIGFGPKLFGFRRGETEYQIAAIPLGGFVRMAGEIPGDQVPEEDLRRSLLTAPWWKRALISLAGPAFNLVFPILALFFVFLGTHTTAVAWVGAVEPQSAAASAGILAGDIITRINGAQIRGFGEISPMLVGLQHQEVAITVKRGETELNLTVRPTLQEDIDVTGTKKRGLLGVSPIARPAIIGVAPGSAAEASGLRTFDRIVSVNGQVVQDEIALTRALGGAASVLEIEALRLELFDVGGAFLAKPVLIKATIEKQVGEGLIVLGAEGGDLYAWNVFANSHAQRLGLEKGDRLLSLDSVALRSWGQFLGNIGAAQLRTVRIRWRHGLEEKEGTLGPVTPQDLGNRRFCMEPFDFGVRPRPAFQGVEEVIAQAQKPPEMEVHIGPLEALQASLAEVPGAISYVASIMKRIATLDVPLESVGGPIQIFQVATQSAEGGPRLFLRNLALFSVNLGLVNLLPIPILDGFALLAAVWEGIRRRPIPMRAREVATMIGFVLLAALLFVAFRNDIGRLLFC